MKLIDQNLPYFLRNKFGVEKKEKVGKDSLSEIRLIIYLKSRKENFFQVIVFTHSMSIFEVLSFHFLLLILFCISEILLEIKNSGYYIFKDT
jgi:hypothetical protein